MARRKKTFDGLKLNEEQRVINEINTLYGKKNIVLYLIAHPGVGKTSICKKINKNHLIYNVSSFTEEDLVCDKPVWYRELMSLSNRSGEDGCLLVFDDFDEFDPTMHIYIYDLLEKERHIGPFMIPDNVNILFCGNAEEYADPLNTLDFKLYSKIKKIDFKPGISDYINWANKNGINRVVKSYLNENPSDLIRDIKDRNTYDFLYSLTPKNWSIRVSNEVNISGYKCNLDYYLDDKTKEKFMDYYDNYLSLGIDDILDGKITNFNELNYSNNDITFMTNAFSSSAYTLEELERVIVFYNSILHSEYKDLFMNLWASINSSEEELSTLKKAIINVSKRGEK